MALFQNKESHFLFFDLKDEAHWGYQCALSAVFAVYHLIGAIVALCYFTAIKAPLEQQNLLYSFV
jgi:hypothetical protein